MEYTRSNRYDVSLIREKIMGPNPLKLQEEILSGNKIPHGAVVMDLGCGNGLTSVFLAKEYGFRVFATDLWSDPTDNLMFFEQMGLGSTQIVPIHADATALPYARNFFDAVVCTDSYNYFGRDPEYLEKSLLPFLKHGGYAYISIPGMKADCHGDLPPELLLSWTPEQLDYIHDVPYWKRLIGEPEGADVVSIHEMESNEEVWNDWLACDNEYAVNDRKTMEAGGGKYLNFIAIILRKK